MESKEIKTEDMPLYQKIGMKSYAGGKTFMEHLEKMTKAPMMVQKKVLLDLLNDAKETEYGRRYHFEEIHSIEDYQKMVPITTFDDYASYIERMADSGERDLITPYELKLYNKSSGTIGKPKRIPMTAKAAEIFYAVNGGLSGYVCMEGTKRASKEGRSISLVQSSDVLQKEHDGLVFGSLSDTSIQQLKPVWYQLYTSPACVNFAGPGVNVRYLHARFALCDAEASEMTASFIPFILEFFRYIENHWEMLVEDIAKGTISSDAGVPEELLPELLPYIKPMPERAEELRTIFAQGFDEPFANKVWPKLAVIMAGMGGTFKTYAHKTKERYTGSIPMFKRGIAASEGMFTAPLALDEEDSVLVPNAMFFEFLPFDENGEADLSHPLTMDQVKVGEKYELVITNFSGFYRYRMSDVFEIKGMYQQTPMIEYLYRANKTLSIMGEKTTEQAIRWAAEETAKACGFDLIESTVYGNVENNCYDYLMEIAHIPEHLTKEKIRDVLEEKLAEANPSMGAKVKSGLCNPTTLGFLQPETYLLYRDMLYYKGFSVGQTKPVTVITNEMQRKFFFGLRELDD